eukprot:9050386-Pyramimonas_sp.AAC.1
MYYMPAASVPIGNMCVNKWALTSKILKAKGLGAVQTLFLASDRQRVSPPAPPAPNGSPTTGAVGTNQALASTLLGYVTYLWVGKDRSSLGRQRARTKRCSSEARGLSGSLTKGVWAESFEKREAR